jgi:hypothetical protein
MAAAMNPVTPQASVVRNANYDRYFAIYRQKNTSGPAVYRGTEDHNFSMMPHELAFSLKGSQNTALSRPHSSGVNDAELKVFSSLNNFPLLSPQDKQRLYDIIHANGEAKKMATMGLRQSIRSKINFVGVPLIAVDARNANAKDTVSIAISGSQTINNTSEHQVHVGDKIVWDIPTSFNSESKSKITPKSKHVFLTVPYDDAIDKNVGGYVSDLISALQTPTYPDDQRNIQEVKVQYVQLVRNIAEKKFSENSTNEEILKTADFALGYTQAMRELIDDVNDRVIGIALSSARPGEAFDIFLKANR